MLYTLVPLVCVLVLFLSTGCFWCILSRRKKASQQNDIILPPSDEQPILTKQPISSFLVVDFEATCLRGSSFDYPNEIIEFPICLLQWTDQQEDGTASTLQVVDQFTSFVQPQFRPVLSSFCTELTGITQEDVDCAPTFKTVLKNVNAWLSHHQLIDPQTNAPLERFVWCSDGPWDIQDFFLKQCFLSQLPIPKWLKNDFLDVRRAVQHHIHPSNKRNRKIPSMNLSAQLQALDLEPFIGRQHRGIDDTLNISRILIELAKRGVRLKSNAKFNPNKRWPWMGRNGQVLDHLI